ncbi:hypothetical protein BC938DRAFT_473720 [Jimgerdemannia flammicorona]|uniref:RBR-type E3 ubiquitin transferase n=1 Tax=Jimgerdemannia flammicorona TaxID=994334 RepID=A0A433Q3P4_9FUNG|nr:hypothetical protein BC938DRAFT_473720 [Jimgerdemannia flammicorona]
MPYQTTLIPSTLPTIPSGAIALAECLPENKALVRLDLSSNPGIDIAGVMALSVSIKMNHTLIYLDVNVPVCGHSFCCNTWGLCTCTRNAEDSFSSEIARRLQEEFDLEESRLRADRTYSEFLRLSILECPICSSEYPVDSTFHIDECGHDICWTCAAQYVQTSIETRAFPCLCPCCRAAGDAENPPSVISQNMLLSVLDEEGQRRWLEIERERAITSDPTVRFTNCRNPECGKPTMLGTATEASDLTSVVCPYCYHTWCERCDTDVWHDGTTCEQYQQWREENEQADERTEQTVEEEGYIKCPGM